MKKIFLFLIIYVTSISVYSQSISLPLLIQKVENSIFTVFAKDEQGNVFSQGSGFIINETGIGITNFHVLNKAFSAQIKMNDGTIIPINSIIDYNKDSDLVKFELQSTGYKYKALHIVNSLPLRGSNVINLSSPLGLEQTVSTGIVSAIRNDRHGTIIQMTTPISPGSSGSPILNDKGQVIGVATFNRIGGQNLNFAVSSIEVNNLSRLLNIPICAIWNNPLESPLIRQAIELKRKGVYDEAINILKKELQYNELNHLAWFELADAERLKCSYNRDAEGLVDAFSHLTNACKLDSLNESYWLVGGVILANISDIANGDIKIVNLSHQCYKRAIDINPLNNEAYYNIAKLIEKNYMNKTLQSDALQIALDAIEKAVILNPTAVNYTQLARIEVHMGKIGDAILNCDRAIDLAPEYPEAYQIRGDAKAFELLDYYGGLVDLEKAVTLSDYYFTDKYQRAMIKGDILGLESTIYWNLFLKEKDMKFLNKSMELIDKAYKVSNDKGYLNVKQYRINELRKMN